MSINKDSDKLNEAKIEKEKYEKHLNNNCIVNEMKDVCVKCYLIECCCEADRLQVIADDEEAKKKGYVEDEYGR